MTAPATPAQIEAGRYTYALVQVGALHMEVAQLREHNAALGAELRRLAAENARLKAAAEAPAAEAAAAVADHKPAGTVLLHGTAPGEAPAAVAEAIAEAAATASRRRER